ncbi:universal stress protein [Microvirga mediterraneensis]|uniref:Universal stress protein n=1 Tax=Microvirga mediterraneensis TaxID=2754695 RepID=A0A838BV06_9HYPH|nr:universal stress protein [Microvirga mediterraneensis]MBA1159080.1 universal stress protein [Microvirga mediterraneensis]
MTIKQVLVAVDDPGISRHVLSVAAGLAARFSAKLVCLYVIPPMLALPFDEVVQEAAQRAQARATQYRALFEGVARAHDLRTEWRLVHGLPNEEAIVHARYSDLVVIARGNPLPPAPSSFPLWPEHVVLAAGRPVIAVPREGSFAMTGKHILVAWNASREATRAVNDALPLLKAANAVDVLLINPGEAHEGPGGHGEEPGADIAAHLARHDIRSNVHVEGAGKESIGQRIAVRAIELNADLIVAGAFGYPRWREMILGGVTQHLLAEASIPILLSQ